MKTFLIKYITTRNTIFFLIGLFLALFIFRKEIKQNKITKAKLEMMERMSDTHVKQWGSEFKNIIDSLNINKVDSLSNQLAL